MLRIFDMLFPPREDEAVLRDVSVDDFLSLVAPKLVSATRPGTVMLLPFSDPKVRSAIHEAKYHGSKYAFKLLSLALAAYLQDTDERNHTIVLVPIPLGKERLKERGFNQTEEVAKRVATELGFRMDTMLLTRIRETASQVSLPRAKREENMRGAFGATHGANPAYTYIVIDDVLTTGATLQAAIEALKTAGASHIIPLALAH